jgi:hypothetical protein
MADGWDLIPPTAALTVLLSALAQASQQDPAFRLRSKSILASPTSKGRAAWAAAILP